MVIINTNNNYISVEESRKYYKEHWFMHHFFYLQINSLLPFLFKNKIKKFKENCEPYFQYNDEAVALLRSRLVRAIANNEYTVNSLSHYHFNIDGVQHIYGISSIYPLFKEAEHLKISSKNVEVKEKSSIKSNILPFKKT